MLFSLLAPVLTTLIFLHFQKKQNGKEIQRQIIHGIDRAELVLLKFTKKASQTDLKWKDAKEFEYKKQMYDIVETATQGDTIYYWCWWDHKETMFNKHLEKLLAYVLGKTPHKNKNKKRLVNFYKSLFCEELPDWNIVIFKTAQMTTPYEFSYLTVSYSPPDPPPKSV